MVIVSLDACGGRLKRRQSPKDRREPFLGVRGRARNGQHSGVEIAGIWDARFVQQRQKIVSGGQDALMRPKGGDDGGELGVDVIEDVGEVRRCSRGRRGRV